ncbi:PilC/PilY family type IV pilus protein [Ramlibacter sp. 2FC]|uniref:pilus assembly protein n=1 Tax=Ramlibacter sp. 2FC TaxID=2502188 RepID=UPI00148509EF|nr:PilC/PilY family type IV pilus protein [Ramlibacter sp. 2FC]
MRSSCGWAGALLALAGVVAWPALAEDVDLFMTPATTADTRPNVLLVLDNAASNNSTITQLDGSSGNKLTMLRQVLDILVDPLNSAYFPGCDTSVTPRVPAGCSTRQEIEDLVKNVNLGLMIANPSGAGKGGYVRYHVRPMNVAANKSAFLSKINPAIPEANNAPHAKSMHEAYLYFAGLAPYVGFDSSQYDPAARSGSLYLSPISDNCQNNNLVFIGNGGPDSGEENDTRTLLNGLGGILSSDPIRFSPSNYQSSWFDEYARTLNRRDVAPGVTGYQNITTHTIAVQNPADNNYNTAGMQSARALLESAALIGGGSYFLAQDGKTALKALIDLLRRLQPVNSVFAAVTLPVSVNVRGTFLNQVYMGQFRPDPNAKPRWPGNLKQYQIGLDAQNNPVLADRFGKPVEDRINGFLLPDVTSFWTLDTSYWSFAAPLSASDAPDGSVVEKGGAAQRLRTIYKTSQADRKLYTCNGNCAAGAPLSSALFADSNTTGLTIANLGVADATERTDLINWVRGADNRNNEDANGVSTDIRAYVHGDLLHSRPAVVNYNRTNDNRDIVVYYGANDGVFRAVKGGQDDSDGYEKWGIVFPEFLSRLKRLRDNTIEVTAATPKPYFADGSVSIYQNDINRDGKLVAADGDKVYLYIGMRRGGRFSYALDVSDPDAPRILWQIDSSKTGFSELAQTWSTLRPTNIRAVSGDPVVIFGGGYDNLNEDPQPATADTMGRGIFFVNGRTGELFKHLLPAGMGSVPADLTVLDRDGNGLADRIYAVDTKGNVWRIDIDNADSEQWQSYKIASLGGSGADARKFLNKTDVVFGTSFDAVLVGSGDREHPFETSVQDRFYMLQDPFVGLSGGLFCGSTDALATCTHAHLADVTSNPYQGGTLPSSFKGWYLSLSAGEKVVGSPVTVFGTVIFGTNRPTPPTAGVCTANLGEARLYQIGFLTGDARVDLDGDGVLSVEDRYSVLPGGGFPPSAVYSPVTINGKRQDVVCVGPRCFKPGGANFDTRRRRTYWYTKQ